MQRLTCHTRVVVASIFIPHEVSASCARNSCTAYGYRKNLKALGHRKQVPQRNSWQCNFYLLIIFIYLFIQFNVYITNGGRITNARKSYRDGVLNERSGMQ